MQPARHSGARRPWRPRPATGDLGPAGTLAAGLEVLGRAGALYADVPPHLRAQLGLPAAPPRTSRVHTGPICHGFSPRVLPRPADWPSNAQVTGYWRPATSRPTRSRCPS